MFSTTKTRPRYGTREGRVTPKEDTTHTLLLDLPDLLHKMRMNHIDEIHLTSTRISSYEITSIAEGLNRNSSVQYLFLSHTGIGDSGAAAIARALGRNQTVSSVYLIGNNIGDEGAIALAETLKTNTSLRLLNLSRNSISYNGAVALAEALKVNSVVKLIYDGNSFGFDGSTLLSEARNRPYLTYPRF
ncbi:hypothetical protein GEMRC1_000366 [Eukaryota sp. GEM-RC1]